MENYEVMGMLYKIREMVLKNTTIQDFHANNYGTTMNKKYLIFHMLPYLGGIVVEKLGTDVFKESIGS